MSGGNGNGDADRREEDRRAGDRRQLDRRLTTRDTRDRRRVDRRRHVRRFVLLAALSATFGIRRASAASPEALILPPSVASLGRPQSPVTLRGPSHFHPFIHQAAAQHSVSATLIEAVIRVESSYNPRAVSRKGARGLMQLMPDTAARFGVRDPFDPQQNVFGGAKYLSVLLAQFEGNVALACAAYNAGEKAVLRYGGIPPYRETREYVEKIRRILEGRGIAVARATAPPEPVVVYTWRDKRGVLNIGQYPPPAGQPFTKRRLR